MKGQSYIRSLDLKWISAFIPREELFLTTSTRTCWKDTFLGNCMS